MKTSSTPGVVETLHALRTRTLTARANVEALLAEIRARDGQIHAWAALDEARALRLADACDSARDSAAEPGALHGLPVGVKDILDTADLPTQMGSPVYADHRPERDAVVVERLERAGAFVLGKTVTTEFAFMQPSRTRNPWNAAHTPGGSSSGSAAAVAAGFVPAAIGTQTNGSVIRPAAYCGVVGFKPSGGAIPFTGGLQFSETLDQIGTFARSAADCARLAAALIEGDIVPDTLDRLQRAPHLGYVRRYPWNECEREALEHFDATLDRLRAGGAVVEEVRLPDEAHDANVVHRTIMLFEAARQHRQRQALHRAQLSAVLNEALDAGAAIATDDYRRAIVRRAAIIERMHDAFEAFDAIVSPPARGAAPATLDVTGDPSFCTLWSLTAFPAITVPSGWSRARLPFGLQLAAPALADAQLLRIANWCEAQWRFVPSKG